MLTFIAVDDEALARRRVIRLVGDEARCLKEFSSAQGVIEFLDTNDVDAIFLDIEMPGISGVELAKSIRAKKFKGKLVFLTAYADFALEAFNVYADGYLVKPIEKQQLTNLLSHLFPSKAYIYYQLGHTSQKVCVEDILIAQSEDKYTKLILEKGEALVEISLKSLLNEYADHFIQIHRHTLVKKDAITTLESCSVGHTLEVTGYPKKLQVSRRAYSILKALL